jgi:hypothetical protein
VLQLFEPAAKLRVDGRPGDGGGLAQLVASPCEPDIYVQAHGAIVELPDCSLQQRDRMVSKALPEHFIKDNAVFL